MTHEGKRWGTEKGRRAIVGVSGSLGSLAALHRAVAEARRTDSEVLAVYAWEPPGGEIGYCHAPSPPLLAAVEEAAVERLTTALDAAFAGGDPGVPLRSAVIRGETGRALVHLADGPDDLLVVGAGGNWLRRGMQPSVAAYCARHAGCPVLTVPTPALQHDLEALQRRNSRRLRTEPLTAG